MAGRALSYRRSRCCGGRVVSDDATWVKIERAKEHIRDLKGEIAAFLERHPYTAVGQDDPQTGDRVIRVRVHKDPPPRMGAIAGDAIHSLRSCLDILAWQLVRAGGGTPNHRTKFPVSGNAKDFEARDLPKIKGASEAAVDRIRTCEPYKGGNDLLYNLHRLDIIQKHRDLIPIGAAVKSRVTEVREWGTFYDYDPRPVYPLKENTELFRIAAIARPQMDVDPQFTFQVAFGESEVAQGEPIIPTLDQFLDLVENIVFRFSDLL